MDENKVVEQTINPLDYVTIPIAEYRALIEETAKKRAKKEFKKQLKEVEDRKAMYYRWYEREKAEKEQLRENLDNAKTLIREKLGIDPDTERIEVEDAES